ncbi:MAG: polysaccharide deacetylase family protein [Solirubrobacterales bacterium]
MATSLAHTDVVRPTIEVSTLPSAMGLDIAASEAIYISPAEQKAAMRRLVRLKEPLYCAGTKKYAALTFDDGPSATTPELVKLLKDEGIPATWFDLGNNANADVAGLKLHASYGPLANHSWSHTALTTLAPRDIKKELDDTQEVFKQQTGQNNLMMRPPYGARNAESQRVTRKLKYAEMLWSADSQDGLAKPWRLIAKNSIDGLGPGAVILFHDGPKATVEALRRTIIPAIRKSGLTMVTLPELLVLNPPSDAQLKAGPKGCSHAGRVNVSGVFLANPDAP